MKGITNQATHHWSMSAGINSEFQNGWKMHLIAQLLDYAQCTLRSMKTARPGMMRGKNNWMFMGFCADSACVGCIHNSMHAKKHYLFYFCFCLTLRWREIRLNSKNIVCTHESYKNVLRFSWAKSHWNYCHVSIVKQPHLISTSRCLSIKTLVPERNALSDTVQYSCTFTLSFLCKKL